MDKKTDSTMDDFLKDIEGVDFLSAKNSEEKYSNPSKTIEEKLVQSEENPNANPDLVGSEYPPEYLKIVERINVQYRLLPLLNYDAIYQEMSDLSIRSSPTPTLEVLSDELHKVQAAKDRLSEIVIDVIKCYNFKKRAVDILKDSWGKFTSEKNTEGRKGDAAFRLSHFMTDFSRTESLSKACDHVLKNLDSLQDNLSRRITIWQLLLKLREGRMAIPDHDFDRATTDVKMDELFNNNTEDKGENKEEDVEPKYRNF